MSSDNYEEKPVFKPYANLIENKSSEMQKSHMKTQKKWIYYIEATATK